MQNRFVTRRSLLRLAGAATMTAALAGALRAEGRQGRLVPAVPPPFASTTPMSIGEVALRVRDLDTMIAFYRDALGLALIERNSNGARMGAGGTVLLNLVRSPDAATEPRSEAGLYHIAFLLPSRTELARWLVHASVTQILLAGFADHVVSESVYLSDPEGNGLEIYSDRPREEWQWNDGLVTMGATKLDIDSILALTDISQDTYRAAPEKMVIGHVHLRIGDIDAGRNFYQHALGLALTADRGNAAFVASGGYHHHVAMNVWNSRGAGPRHRTNTGLDWFSIKVQDDNILSAQSDRLRKAANPVSKLSRGIETIDPWGTRVRLLRT